MPGPLENSDGASGLPAHLVHFAARLREAGVPVGTSELMDALGALEAVGLARRRHCQTALAATLVKNSRYRPAFDRLFEEYFAPPEIQAERARRKGKQLEARRRQMEEASSSLSFQGEQLSLSEEEILLYCSLPATGKARLQQFVQATSKGKNVEARHKPLLETVVKGHLTYWRHRLDREEFERELQVQTGSGGGDGGVASGGPGSALRELDMGQISTADLPTVEALLNRLARNLVQTLFRRQYLRSYRGPLDLRRTLRDNLRYGGSLYYLRFRRKTRTRPQLLLICDVSASMQRYSTFVLQFIYGLQAAVYNLESFIYADGLEYLSPSLEGRGYLRSVLDRVVKKSAVWGGGTNLGAALEELQECYPELPGARTTVLIVSDTRTRALGKALIELDRLRRKVRRVIWLNPLPPAWWPRYRSVRQCARLSEMWPCQTIAQLEQVVAGICSGSRPGLKIVSTAQGGRK